MASLVKHVENNLYTNGYKCMLCEVGDNPNRIEEFVEMLQRNVMDGIICCADIPSSVSLAEIHRPIVMIDRYVTEGIPCIHSDHKRGGELAVSRSLLKRRMLRMCSICIECNRAWLLHGSLPTVCGSLQTA